MRKLAALGIQPLAWSDEPWQVATVFEAVLLSEAGPALYRELIVQRKSSAWMDPRVERALARLRWLRNTHPTHPEGPREQPWTAAARDLLAGKAAMLVMGDWAKGELIAWGASPAKDFGCVVLPGTENMHLYSIDTLAMLANGRHREATQEKVAELVSSAPAQLAYNRIKAIHHRMQLGGAGVAVRFLRFAGFTMDLLERQLIDPAGVLVVLTSMDFNLLRFLAEHAGETLDRGRLMEQTRGRDLGPLDRSLDVQVSRLRQRLNDDSKQPQLVKTVRGSGYVFSADVVASEA